jgi:hypothetical protein
MALERAAKESGATQIARPGVAMEICGRVDAGRAALRLYERKGVLKFALGAAPT